MLKWIFLFFFLILVGTLVPLGIEKGSWVFPPDFDSLPLLCVCAGTGIAPLKAIIQDRFQKLKNNEVSEGKTNIFFLYFVFT